MIKLLLIYLIISYISSEQILTIYPQEKRVMNAGEGGKIPLIVKPSEDVNEDIEFTCNGNIRYNFWNTTFGYDVLDLIILPKIPAGTKAGTEIKFNCFLIEPVFNEVITLDISEKFLDPSTKEFKYFENMKWKDDENNNQIEYVPKFVVSSSYTTSKNLEKNDIIHLDIALMDDIKKEISISNETFILNKEELNGISINLISCRKIPIKKKGNIKITCLVEEEVKDGRFVLRLGQGKKIDGIEPKVEGYVVFSADGPTHDDIIIDEDISTQGEGSTNYSKILQISLIIFILLF